MKETVLCLFFKTLEETPMHVFYNCIHVKSLTDSISEWYYSAITYTTGCYFWAD